ncbi:MAG: YitT family protein [Eubacteriales bacterium]|nr:YitT family protein [Eubacteriales bacterium]
METVEMDRKAVFLEKLQDYTFMSLGTLLLAIGNFYFKFPNNFSFGGVTGIGTVLAGVLPFSTTQITNVFNIAFLILGFILLDKGFGIKTVFVTLLFSGMLTVMDVFVPMTHTLTNQPVLELLFAIALPAIGSAMIFNRGASSGGTDILAMILKRYTGLDIGKSLIVVDVFVVISAFFLYGSTTGLFSAAGLFAKALVTNNAISDMNLNKYFTVICDDSEEILAYIQNELNRTATVYHAEGAYSHKNKTVILTVMSPMQATKLRNFIRSTQPTAFLMITNSSEIDGKGFHTFH